MFDHEYTLVAHPHLRARLSYRSEDGDLAAATVRLDYRRDDERADEAVAVAVPDDREAADVEWRGLSISLYRDDERVLERGISTSLVWDVVDAAEALAPPAQAAFEVYQGTDGKWRWRLVHDNGNVIADSGPGYSSRRAAEKGLRSVKRNALGAPVERAGAERNAGSGTDADESAGADAGTAES